MREKSKSRRGDVSVRARYSYEEKLEHVRLWEQSGLSGLEYARQNGLHDNAPYSWRSKLLKAGIATVQAEVQSPCFVSLDMPVASSLQVTLRLQGMELSIDGCTHHGELIKLLGSFKKEVADV